MSKSSNGKYRKFISDGKEYLFTRYDLLRLELLEKISSIVAVLILVMTGLVLLTTVWVYISCILIVWMEGFFGSFIPPFIIMGSVSILILAVIVLLREKLVLNPLIKIFSKIMFTKPEGEEENSEDENSEDENNEKPEL